MKDWEPRFWAKVEKLESCWIWTACKTVRGYGQFRLAGRGYRAHRLSYALVNGPIPDGAEIDHQCHSTSCVNPAHLRAVTKKQNMENRAGPQRRSRSGVRGVSWNKGHNRWVAHVTHNHTQMHLGYFNTIAEAEAAAISTRNHLFTHNDIDRKSP